MAVKVAINGFGRIGRLALRLMANDPEFDVVAINDLTDAAMLAHLFKYDTAQGRFNGEIEVKENAFVVNGKEIKTFADADPENLPWGQLGVDVVLECTGFFTSKEKAEKHIKAGAKKVVISAPGSGDMKTVVFNVNNEILDGTETVLSAASCTTNCLAPMAKVLQDNFGIEAGSMTTIHAYTGDQNTLDAPQRVPVPTGSLTEVISILGKKVTKEEVNAAMKAASNESFGYTEEPLVSSDIVGIHYGSLFDATQTKVIESGDKQLVKTVSWYDNEMSYTAQLVRTLKYFVELAK